MIVESDERHEERQGRRPAVSIVMAEYNTHESHLREAISSIVNQTFTDYELIIVDDGGNNDLAAIVSEFNDERIMVIQHATNMGFVAALETGIAAASAELVARMDTDDVYLPTHLENLVQAARDFPDFAVYSARSQEFSNDGRRMVMGTAGEKTVKSVLRGSQPSHPATLIRKSALLSVGGYPDYHRAEDLALWCEMLLHGYRLCTIEPVTHLYRVDLADYRKRRLRNRRGELGARLHYYPRLGAGPADYLKVVRTIAGGILPGRLVRSLRRWERRDR